MKADEVGVIEAAYGLHGTETEWLDGIARAAAPLLDAGLGVAAVAIELAPSGVHVRAASCFGGPPAVLEAFGQFMRHATPSMTASAFRVAHRSPVRTFSSAVGGTPRLEEDPASQAMFSLGIRDAFGILGTDGRYQISVSAWLPETTRPSRRAVSRWSRIASHLGAAFRVRRGIASALAEHAGPMDTWVGSEAVLTPAGRVEHAQGAAQRAQGALGRAVLAVERARGRLRADDPDEALEAWRGLVAGRWSLLEHFDTDGKRFIVARRNDPDDAGPAGLSPRECQVLSCRARGMSLKLIAYDLGLSMATVSKTLDSGMTKLGVASDMDLPRLFGDGPSGPSGSTES